MRRPRCPHVWETVGTSYSPPVDSTLHVEITGGEAIADYLNWRRLLSLGHTDVSLHCTICGDVATRVLEGRWSDESAKRAERLADRP